MASTRKPLTPAQIQQLWVREGGSRDWATTMAQIAGRESSGKYWINNAGLNKNGTVDHGLFQINDIWRSDPVIQRIGWQNRYDPVANTKMAVRVFQAQGPKAWATYQGHVANVPTTGGIPGGAPRATRAAQPSRTTGGTTTTRTTTTPGVDNSQLRRSLIADFLGSGGVKSTQATQQLAAGWLGAQDIPGTSSTATTTTPGRTAPPSAAPASARPLRGTISPHARPGSPVAASRSVGGLHETMGLAGYPAHDYFAPAGSHAVAPVTGTVVRLSGHDPSAGPVQGPHGPLGWSVYIKGSDGRTYYLTHMGSRNVKVGQKVKQGQVIGTVANYDRYGTPSHIHMGVNG